MARAALFALLLLEVRLCVCVLVQYSVAPGHYFNLSCPFEWSKYSCAHQGKLDVAERARQFAESSFGQIKALERRVVMIGDSFTRQLLISAACSDVGSIAEYKLDWPTNQKPWPCHGTPNCIQYGEHSGFNVASILWKHGGELHFLPRQGSKGKMESNIIDRMSAEIDGPNRSISFGRYLEPFKGQPFLTQDDVIIYNQGYHNDYDQHEAELQGVRKFVDKLDASRERAPFFIYFTTPTQHFDGPNHGGWVVKAPSKKRVTATKPGSRKPLKGKSILKDSRKHNEVRATASDEDSTFADENDVADEYNELDLDGDLRQKGGTCLEHASDDRRADTEREVLKGIGPRNLVVDVMNAHDLGAFHIGSDKSGTIDCTHYCQPGVPDVMAKHLFDAVADMAKP